MMKFYKTPFVFITIAYIFGLLLELTCEASLLTIFYSIIVSLALAIYFKFKDSFYLIIGLFLCLGMSSDLASDNLREFNNSDSLLLKVDEVSVGGSEWNKVLATVYGVNTSKGVVGTQDHVLLYSKGNGLRPGDQLIIKNDLIKIENKGNPGEFNSEMFWRSKGVHRMGFITSSDYVLTGQSNSGIIDGQINKLRNFWKHIIISNLSEQEASVALAMLIGDKSFMSQELKASFGNAGAAHVLAVSGLHVGIILTILIGFFQWFNRYISRRIALIFALVCIWIFVAITGFTPSVNRAAFMFTILTIGSLRSSNANSINTLFFSAFVMLIIDPNLILDIGFQLSYLAMLGIFLFYPTIERFFMVKYWLLRKVWQGTAVGISAQLMTFPITLYYFHQFPNYFFLSNLGVMAFAGLIMCLGIGLLFIGKIPGLNFILGLTISYVVLMMTLFIHFVNELPFSLAQGFILSTIQVIILFALILISYWFLSEKMDIRKILFLGTLMLSVLIWIQFDRYQNLNDQEIVVFNSRTPLISLKLEDKLLFIHRGETISGSEKLMIESYAQFKGMNYETVWLKDELKIQTKNYFISFRSINNRIEFRIGKVFYQYVLGYQHSSDHEKCISIGAPYLSGKYNYSLKQGAYIIDL